MVIINIAAPKGIFNHQAVPIFEGRFSGNVPSDKKVLKSMFTLSVAPGSSGSMVLNENGELVGMITGTSIEMSSQIALGVPHFELKRVIGAL